MANVFTQRNSYTVTAFSFLCLLVFIIFFFSYRVLEPTHSLYRDHFSETLTLSELAALSRSNSPSSDSETVDESSLQVIESVTENSSSDEEERKGPAIEDESAVENVGESVIDSNVSKNSSEFDDTRSNEEERKGPAIEDESAVENVGQSVIDSNVSKNSSEFDDTRSNEEERKDPAIEDGINQSDSNLSKNSSEFDDASSNAAELNSSAIEDAKNESADDNGGGSESESGASVGKLKWSTDCDLYTGKWVKDEDRPIYSPGSCPYIDEAFDCQGNGRPDSEYLNWRWKPDGCDLPRFNATDFLVRLRGKRLMLVGDSMNRNQFESLLCLLREGLSDKRKMYEVHGYKITKGRGYYIFKVEGYDCSIEFVRSHFLVKEGTRINGQGNSNPTLSIDRIDKSANRWKRADILVFNTGHWWTHGKTARGKNYYKEGDHIYPKFDAAEAYKRALTTWSKWVDRNMKSSKKLVIYRGYSSAHFRGGDWDSGGTCNGETEPISSGAFLDSYPLKMKIVDEVIQAMEVPVVLLNVTRLTNFRKDGHPSVYGKNVTAGKKVSTRRQDCSHWCLPGVPDAWNELIYATLVIQQTKPRTKN